LKSPDADFHRALQYAFLLLRYRDRSEKELFQRLQRKGFAEETSRNVGSYLREKDFLNDARLAESLKRTAVEQKHLGKRGLVHYLSLKGIPAEIVDNISGNEEDYVESAASLVERKLGQMKGLDEIVVKRRLWGLLVRKGYSPAMISRVLKRYLSDDESCP